MRTPLLTLIAIIGLAFVSNAQCNLVVSESNICGNQAVTAYISNSSDNFDYRIMVNSLHIGGPQMGDSVTIYPPGSGDQYTVTLTPQRKGSVGGFVTCGNPKQVVVRPTPNADLDFLSGGMNTQGVVTNCGADASNPNFLLEISNASTTAATNTIYTINWGDGSPVETMTSFTTLSHNYSLGFFTMSYSVDGAGNASCRPTTVNHKIFNGSSPTVGIEDPNNFIGSQNLCPPVLASFDLVNTENNVEGTLYELYIGGELIETYAHPPPSSFQYEFIETSCGKTASNGVPNTYDVTIQAFSPCPAPPDFATLGPIIIGDTVSPDFIYNPDPICVNEVITFTNTTEGTVDALTCAFISDVKWTISPATGWQLISGDMAADNQIQVMFDNPANYDVTVEAMNSCDTLEETKTLEVNELPFADALAVLDNPDKCAPAIATFTNLSTQDTSVTYNWTVSPSNGVSFINGTNNSTFEPEIQFTKEGSFKVTLTVSNACGSPQWDTIFDISAKAEFEIAALGNVCADTFIYNEIFNFSGNPDSVVWSFVGGEPNSFVGENPPAITFVGSGNYSISASAYNICGVTTVTENFTVSEPVEIDAGNDIELCFNQAPVTLVGSPANGVWTGEGIVGTDVFDPTLVTQDNVTLTYTFDNGICFFVDSINAEVIRVEDLSAGADQGICVNGTELTLTGQSPLGGTWIGDAVTDGTLGTFDPQLGQIGNNEVGYIYTEPRLGCQDTVFKNVTILDIPTIAFNLPDTVCLNASVDFSLNVDSSATVNWNFGDGNSLTGSSVDHSYTSEGIYTVTAEVIQNGCSVMDSIQIQVITIPTSDFAIDNATGCNAFQVNFTNASTGHIESISWDLGNGQTSTDLNPQNITFEPGVFFDTTYYVTLTSYNQCGEHSMVDSVMVSKAPEARFGTNLNAYCQDEPVLINNVSYNSPTDFYWDFGNGNTSTAENPGPQIYPTSANDTIYTILLVASNVCGSDTATKDILIKSVDVTSFFNIDKLSGCEPLDVTLINFSSVGANPVWDLGDGNTSISDTVQHTFQDAGFYTIVLAVDNGCSKDTSSITIEVFESPAVQFSLPDRACELSGVQFQNNTINGVEYSWDFGDGNVSDLTNPSHVFNLEGNYNVTLTAKGTNLCESSITKPIEIVDKPNADFDTDVNRICEGAEVQFTNMSTGENFEWDFGNGKKSFIENPLEMYDKAGLYDVMLITDNDQFCYDTIIKKGVVEAFSIPIADFDYSQDADQILEGTVSFENLSSSDATSFLWNFGDDEFYFSEENPTHTYTQSGPYSVLLIAENDFGCIDSIVKPIFVEFFGKLFVPNAMSPALGSNTEASIFKPKGVGLIEYELEIYSTYGELLYRTDLLIDGQPAEGWDGTFKGKPMPQDNYVWKIRAMFDNGLTWGGMEGDSKEVNTLGTLVLIR